MVSATQIRDGVLEYASARVLPKLTPGKQFAAGTALGIVAARADELLRCLAESPVIKATGIIAENGMVDLDALYDSALTQLKRQKTLPVDVPFIGKLTFDENDITELYRTISAR